MLDKLPRAGTISKHAEGVKAYVERSVEEGVSWNEKMVNTGDEAGISGEIRADQMHETLAI